MKKLASTRRRVNSRHTASNDGVLRNFPISKSHKELAKNRTHVQRQIKSPKRPKHKFDETAETEEKLRKCSQLLKDIQRITRLGNWEWDIHTGTVVWSDELYRIFGLSREMFETTYESYLARVHPDDRARVQALIESSLQTRRPFTSEHRIVRLDGTVRFLETEGEVMTDEQNRPVRMLGCCRDVTERKQNEQKIAASISLLTATLESTADGILVVDLEGRLTSYNQKFIEMWRLPPNLMESFDHSVALASSLQQLKNPDAFMERVRYLYGHPELESFDVVKFKDGRVFERFSKPQKIGETIVGRVWSFRDVSEKKRAEQTIKRERDLTEAILNSLPGLFYLLDETGLNLRWNKNLEIVTGYSAAEIAQMHASDFVPEEEKQMLVERVKKVFSAGQADVELHVLCKDGRRIPYVCTGMRVEIEGKPRLVGMGIDISELQKAKEQIKNLNHDLTRRVKERTAQLDATNRELEAFSYSVSHDLRAPLRAISGFAKLLKEDYDDRLNEDGMIFVEKILQAGDRMSHLIDDLLNYSRIGRSAIKIHPVPLRDLIRATENDFADRIRAIGGKLWITDDLPVVLGEVSLLGQIFANIFENAIIYRKPDVPLELRLTTRKEADHVVICISDNGIGISPEHHARIFEVFQRLHAYQQYPGTGIGLANAKKSVELLDGKIWVESELGKGSTFCVQLKLASAPDSAGTSQN